MTCALCGLEFNVDGNVVCAGCLLRKKCEKICCPRCGYETVKESALIGIARRIFRKAPTTKL